MVERLHTHGIGGGKVLSLIRCITWGFWNENRVDSIMLDHWKSGIYLSAWEF